MILSHKNNLIFFKPMKCAGSSVEIALSSHCGPDDIITGTSYIDEQISHNYPVRNNIIEREVSGKEAIDYLVSNNMKDSIPKDVDKSKVAVKIISGKHHTHTTPFAFKQDPDLSQYYDRYLKVTIVRNPWDAMVSYYWWCYTDLKKGITTPDGKIINANDKNNKGMPKSLRPLKSDTIKDLKIKFNKFINIRSKPIFGYGNSLGPVSYKFSKFFESFYDDDIDYVMRFEKIQSDYDLLCKGLSVSTVELPMLKSSYRLNRESFLQYYDNKSMQMIGDLFSKTIDQFSYQFR